MFVNSNENEYGDQENSSSSGHHDEDDDFSSLSSKSYGNNNDENQNLRQLSLGGGCGGGNQSNNQFSILSSPIDEECQFDLLNPIEKFFKLCENPTPTNMLVSTS